MKYMDKDLMEDTNFINEQINSIEKNNHRDFCFVSIDNPSVLL